MATDLPDWRQSVEVSGPITAVITGPVTVTGTINVANAVTVASITDPVTVGSITNTVNVAAPSAINVKTAGSTSVTIAGTVNITGTPAVTISGTPNVAIASGTVDATVLNSSLTIAGGPVTVDNVSSTVLQVGDEMVLLYNTKKTFGTAPKITFSTAGYIFSAFMVIVVGAATKIPYCALLTNTIFTHITPAYNVKGTLGVAPFGPATITPGSGGFHQFTSIVPLPTPFASTGGGTAQLTIHASGNLTAHILIYGLTSSTNVKLRSDGRAWPLGGHNVSWVTTFTAKTVIAAPATPLRVMVCRVMNVGETAAGSVTWLGFTQNGSAQRWYLGPGTVNGVPVDFTGNGGLLCDAHTAVTIHSGASHAWVGAIQFDYYV